jgi:hypothetical protein
MNLKPSSLERIEQLYQNKLLRVISVLPAIILCLYGLITYEPFDFFHLSIPLIISFLICALLFLIFFRSFKSVLKAAYLFLCISLSLFGALLIINGYLEPQVVKTYDLKPLRFYEEKATGRGSSGPFYFVELNAKELGRSTLTIQLSKEYYEILSDDKEAINIKVNNGFLGLKWISKPILSEK